jgi:probable rRNA maturation factor
MILLDPDLDPDLSPHRRSPVSEGHDPAPDTISARRSIVSAPLKALGKHRLPSARALAGFLKQAQIAVRLRGKVTVLLTTDVTMRRLNRSFRGKNKATDVLSFPAPGTFAAEVAGDVAISIPTALRQAEERGHALSTEIKVLMLHGLLHLAGYDHEADSGQMGRRERVLRGRLRLPQGLIERAKDTEASGFSLKRRKSARSARGGRR